MEQTQDLNNAAVNTNEAENSMDETAEKTFTLSEVDRKITQALQTQKAKLEATNKEDIEKAVADALAEQQRLSALTEQEREKEARQKAEQALAEKEAELNRKALIIDVNEILVNEGLPKDTINLVLGKDLNETKTNIATLKGLIDAQVQVEVNKLITKPGAPSTQKGGPVLTKAEIMRIKDDEERKKQIMLHPHLFNY